MPFRSLLPLAAALLALPLAAQQAPLPNAPGTGAGAPVVLPKPRPIAPALKPYVGCRIPGGPDLVQTTPLPEAPMTRAAQTLTGPVKIKIADGVFAAFAYPGGAPFANVKIEQLPAASYSTEKPELISEFDKINATGRDTQRNYALKPVLNGFEIYGFDRTSLDGNVLGIYLFFDNAHHVATTAYFLNAPLGQRRFSNLAEYNNLREGFLEAYTQCVHKAIAGGGSPSRAKPAPSRKPVARSRKTH